MQAFDTPKTKAMKKFLEVERARGRVVGLSIEFGQVFIYTDSSKWCTDDAGCGTFMAYSETAAIKYFYDVVQDATKMF